MFRSDSCANEYVVDRTIETRSTHVTMVGMRNPPVCRTSIPGDGAPHPDLTADCSRCRSRPRQTLRPNQKNPRFLAFLHAILHSSRHMEYTAYSLSGSKAPLHDCRQPCIWIGELHKLPHWTVAAEASPEAPVCSSNTARTKTLPNSNFPKLTLDIITPAFPG